MRGVDIIGKKLTLFLIVLLFLAVIVLFCFNRFVLPIMVDICSKYAVTTVNNEISSTSDEVIREMQLTTKDLTEEISQNDTSHINLDSLLINRLTTEITKRLSVNLNELESHELIVPMGTFSGIPLLSRVGFDVPLYISSMGDAKADYSSTFTSAGVNQTAYQVWLDIECNVTIVSPIFGKNICVKRKLMLVNTIFNGKVPDGYANIKLK